MRFSRALPPITLVLAAAHLGAPLFAQARPETSGQEAKPSAKEVSVEDELNILLNVEIVSVSKVAQRPIDAPGVVGAVSRDQLRDFGWLSLNEVMGNQPGFVPSQDYDRRTVSARGVFEGWNNNHILVLVDGVPFNDNLYGSAYTWEITPLFMAKSLEIMRGPGSALYGSNAVNGVASLNTLKADDIQGGGEARFRLGEHGTQVVDAITGNTGDLVSFVASVNHTGTNGNEYDSPDLSGRTDGSGNPLSFRTHDHRASTYFFAKIDGLLALDGWSFQYHQQKWSFGTGHGWAFYIPDIYESMSEERRIAVLKYAKESGNVTQEYALRYQWHGIDWNQRYYPASAGYPGMTEYLNTSSDELFGRAQLTWKLSGEGSIVAGFEGNRFYYGGDKAHYSNTDINGYGLPVPDGTQNPTADGSPVNLRGFLEWTQGHPVIRTAVFAQWASGKVFDKKVSLTLGLRYDKQTSDFNALDKVPAGTPSPTEKLSYSQTSPRVGLIYHANSNYSLKLLVGRAFRTPAPSETFGANTYALASNIRGLQPEIADTLELASDWIINKNLNWRINAYEAKLKNLIAYSSSNNKSVNLYTLKTRGLETELLWNTGRWSGFFNASKSKRVDETILDTTIPASSEVTWMPSLTANLGAALKVKAWTVSGGLHYQGEAKRRDNELAYPANRPDAVQSFTSANLRVAFKPTKGLEVELGASNAFDQKGYYAKNFSAPFDYRTDPRTVWLGLRIN